MEILQNFVAFSEYMNFKLLDKIHKNWPQWASDPPRPAIEAQNRPTNLRGQEAEPRDFALLQKKYLSSSTENPNFRSINLELTYTFLVMRNILVHCYFYFNATMYLWKMYLEFKINNTKELNFYKYQVPLWFHEAF